MKAVLKHISKTSFYSWKKGKLPKGCALCVRGEKLVIFCTGLCPNKCFYCPISEQKSGKDVVYANEWKIANEKDIITEAKLTRARGAGITGGDPLVKLSRVVHYIHLLKKKFGKKFHIHLYTPLTLVNEARLKKLYSAGLDEIRFHPMLDRPNEWPRILFARKFDWDVGVEIPVIPGKKKQTICLLKFIEDKVDFLNLNELEISDTNVNKLVERGFRTKDDLSYAVEGSQEMAMQLLNYLKKSKLNVHYCTAQTKDRAQLSRRIKRRALNVAKKFDFITKDGTLVRGCIYLKGVVPGIGYRKLIEKSNKKLIVQKLTAVKKIVQQKFRIPNSLIEVDPLKLRIITSIAIVDELSSGFKKLGLIPAVVEEYPTWDAMEVDVRFI